MNKKKKSLTHEEILEKITATFLPSDLEIVLCDLTHTFKEIWPSSQSSKL